MMHNVKKNAMELPGLACESARIHARYPTGRAWMPYPLFSVIHDAIYKYDYIFFRGFVEYVTNCIPSRASKSNLMADMIFETLLATRGLLA